MQSGLILLILAASLAVASPAPAWGPGPVNEMARSFTAPPPLPPIKPRQARLVSDAELRCLALTVYWEAGREPHAGQLAVAHVVLNRVGEPAFAANVCDVVHQGGSTFPCQFHWYCGGRETQPRNQGWWVEAQRIARQAAMEEDPTGGALYFHLVTLRPHWAVGLYDGAQVIGHHIFFRGRP